MKTLQTQIKSILTTLVFISSLFTLSAQAPEGINYQAVVRDGSGNIVANQNVDFKLTISENGSTVYSEEHLSVNTSNQGLVDLVIGEGMPISGTFSSINWNNGDQENIQIEVDLGSGYVSLGTQYFESVPYALNTSTQIFEKDSLGISYVDTLGGSEKIYIGTNNLQSNEDIMTISKPFSILSPPVSDAHFISFQEPSLTGPITLAAINTDGSAEFTAVQTDEVEFLDTLGASSAPDPSTLYGDNAPMAWGYVNGSGGSLLNDFGVSSISRNGSGDYTITLDNNWIEQPAIIITPITASGAGEIPGISPILQNNNNTFDISVYDSANPSTQTDTDFMFVVFGRSQ